MEPRSSMPSYGQRSTRSPSDPLQRISPASESSDDDDDDDIPAKKLPRTSPSKPLALSAACPTVHGTKRPLSDATPGAIVCYPGSKKPRNGYNLAPVPRASPPRSTPDSLRGRIPNRSPTGSVSSEYDVREGLVRSMNDALRHLQGRKSQDDDDDDDEQQRGLEAAPIPNNTESKALEDVGSGMNDHDSESLLDIPHLELSASPLEFDVPNSVSETDTAVAAALPNGEEQAEVKASTQAGTTVQQPGDLWEIPSSPDPREISEPISYTDHMQQPTRKRGRPRKNYPRLRGETDNDYHTRIARLRKKPIPAHSNHDTRSNAQSLPVLKDTIYQATPEVDIQLETEPKNHSTCDVSGVGISATGENLNKRSPALGCEEEPICNDLMIHKSDDDRRSDASDTSKTLSDFIEGFDSDPETYDDANHSLQENFGRDVKIFEARQARDPEETDAFESPMDDDVLTVCLDHQPLKQLWEVLSDEAWAGVKKGWQWRPFHYEHAKTKPARALLPLLTKLERLYQVAPSAPKLKEQNQFLREHADMLRYYFYKIKLVIEHIRTKRLTITQNTLGTQNTDTRKRKRMTRDLVAYILPMLAHVLASAWRLGGKTWTKPSFTGTAVELLKRITGWIMILHHRLLSEARVSLVLDNLYDVVSAAPDQLAEKEAHIKAEAEYRQQRLEREKQLEIKKKAAEEARRTLAAERKIQSLLSIRAMHQCHDTPTTSSRPSPSPTIRSPEWSVEERRLLFLRIQASFPTCPDLSDLHWELNKTIAQTVAMTEQILGKILKKVLRDYSAEERAAELRRIMQSTNSVHV
ncbi:hypothetical protein NPX13_g6784 [Xylaria arbuscula]|uniref:Uncharacterized protein n=1 Tax=Xylaria arbuscula TaxID=114810 RepID=A0A9W8TJT4_9PEZI|nr:hypothetical protein NPX13_g6784 [Xylaria arbuscula]